MAGIKTFPNFNTMWHFDDKVGQKYLLEAIDAPLVPTWIFYDKMQAIEWANQIQYPLVFKLRSGAGSLNVSFVKNRAKAVRLIKKAFGKGFNQYNAWHNLRERVRKYRLGTTSLFDILKGTVRLVYPPKYSSVAGREKGYAYFQKFIDHNDYDIRVIVIGNKAFAIKRMVRHNDFRASGSGDVLYNKDQFDNKTICLSFRIAEKLRSQCVAFDFIYNNEEPLIVEISYGFIPEVYDPCAGYWTKDMTWHKGSFNPYGWMIDDLVRKVIK